MDFTLTPARVLTTCESCKRPVELECGGFAGPTGYPTYNEFSCPHCRKISRARTSGAILAVHKGAGEA